MESFFADQPLGDAGALAIEVVRSMRSFANEDEPRIADRPKQRVILRCVDKGQRLCCAGDRGERLACVEGKGHRPPCLWDGDQPPVRCRSLPRSGRVQAVASTQFRPAALAWYRAISA